MTFSRGTPPLEHRREKPLPDLEDERGEEPFPGTQRGEGNYSLVRTTKSVVIRNDDSLSMDPGVISPVLYNSFHYSLLPKTEERANFVVGVTSARAGDGKTTVAANLAVSMALSDEREAVLVDLNLRSPRLHSVFALSMGPGLAEALSAPMVHVARTTVRHLHVITLGNLGSTFSGIRNPGTMEVGKNGASNGRRNGKRNGQGNGKWDDANVATMPSFKHVMQSLRQRFEIIIFDMPSVSDPILPMNLTRQMDGMVLVVDATRTTKDDVTRTAQRLGRDRVLGIVLNRAKDAA